MLPTAQRVTLMSRLPLALIALLAIGILSGCGASFRPTGYLPSYKGLVFVGENSDLAYAIDQPLPADANCAGLYLPPVVYRANILRGDAELRENIMEALQGRVFYWTKIRYQEAGLQVSNKEPNVADLALTGRQAYQLDIAVTEVRKGIGVLRWLIGMYLGASTFQVEGYLRSLPERKVIARYTCRVVFSGDSYFGLNPKSATARYCLRVSADWAARDIAELPGLVFKGLRDGVPQSPHLMKEADAKGAPQS